MNKTDDFFSEETQLSQADQALLRVYADIGRSVDELAYTPEFEDLYRRYTDAGFKAERRDVFGRLLILRKAGLLPRLFRVSA